MHVHWFLRIVCIVHNFTARELYLFLLSLAKQIQTLTFILAFLKEAFQSIKKPEIHTKISKHKGQCQQRLNLLAIQLWRKNIKYNLLNDILDCSLSLRKLILVHSLYIGHSNLNRCKGSLFGLKHIKWYINIILRSLKDKWYVPQFYIIFLGVRYYFFSICI